MNTTVVPFRPRRPALSSDSARTSACELRYGYPTRSRPIRIDRSVSLYQLLTGLQSVGLSLRREPSTGVYIISPKRAPHSPQ